MNAAADNQPMAQPDALDRRLLNEFQRDFPLCERPYAAIAERLGVSESVVIDRLRALHDSGAISRIGAVVRPHQVGVSTLAALEVPPAKLETVAELISAMPQVNHNYEREHRLNLWFVATAADRRELDELLGDIETLTGLSVTDLPLVRPYHIDLGFPLWN